MFLKDTFKTKAMSAQKNTLHRMTHFNRLLAISLRQVKNAASFILGLSRLKNDDFYFW